ncbi:hypothetical protein ABW21_db0201477 [Orbilia brochopaga]|nr:hypothetical protein ABW21_db0201477 [Drechslerella brochopaga]
MSKYNAKDLADALREGRPYDAEEWAQVLMESIKGNDIAHYLTDYPDMETKKIAVSSGPLSREEDTKKADYEAQKYLSLFKAYVKNPVVREEPLKSLLLGSIGKLLLAIDSAQYWGFAKVVNEERCQTIVNESLLDLLSLTLEVHIDRQIAMQNESIDQNGVNPEEHDILAPRRKKLATLAELATDASFVTAFEKVLYSDTFEQEIQDIEKENLGPFSTNYRMCMLYVHEYFKGKKTPTIRGHFSATGDTTHIIELLQNWLHKTKSRTEGDTFANVIEKIMKAKALDPNVSSQILTKNWTVFCGDLANMIASINCIYVPGRKLNAPYTETFRYVLEALQPDVQNYWPPDIMEKLSVLTADITPIQIALASAWNKQMDQLRAAMQTSMNEAKPVNEQLFFDGTNWPGMYEQRWHGQAIKDELSRLNYTGSGGFSAIDDVDRVILHKKWQMWKSDYIQKVARGEIRPDQIPLFGSRPANSQYKVGPMLHQQNHTPKAEEPASGCFAPGTLVWTDYGELPIETLRENQRILTRASTGEFGIKSDEVVALPVESGSALLYGFNDEKPFFTRNHVFHTTTGRRALDPVSAKLENPWLEVGQLRVGHTLIHTSDGETYEFRPILSFTKDLVPCDNVWGIHLREGLRSYHANGYLVHLNYPEITIKSIADSIKKLPKDQQTNILRNLDELKPIFARFGGGAVQQLLARELADDELLRTMRHKSPEEFPPQPLYFQSRSYMVWTEENLDHGYNLPHIDCLDGVLYVKGVPCKRSRILERGFAWSRQVSEELWEHGMCTFGEDRNLLVGDGIIWLLKDENPTTSETKPFRFQVQSISLRQEYLEMLETPLYQKQLPTQKARVYEQVRQAPAGEMTEFEELLLSSEDPHQLFGSETKYQENASLVDQVEGHLPRPPGRLHQNVDEIYNVKYCRDVFDYQDVDDPPVPDTYLFQITRQQSGDLNGIKTVSFRIPVLDKLAEVRQQKLNQPELLPFYKSECTLSKENNFEVLITITQPEILALAADDNAEGDDDCSTTESRKNLKYNNSDSDLVLPFIFSKLQFRVGALRGILKGKMTEYEPNIELATEDEGKRHRIEGAKVKADLSPYVTMQGSTSPAAPVGPGAPAPITQSSSAEEGIKSQINLISNLGVKSDVLKQDAQNYIYRAMLFHMGDEDRVNMTDAAKPNVSGNPLLPEALPTELGPLLEDELRDWLRDEYCIAYIASHLSKQPEAQQKQFKAVFTEDDIKRLEYWWYGKGASCLSRSSEYNRLNTLATMISFRRRVPRIMQYLSDTEKGDVIDDNGKEIKNLKGGKKWAYLYFHQVSRDDVVDEIAHRCQYTDFTGLNPLEYHCTVLNALWVDNSSSDAMDGGKLAEKLSGMVHRRVREKNLFKYSLIQTPETLENGLRDNLASLLEILLDEKAASAAGMNPGVRKKLVDDLQRIADWRGQRASDLAKEQK